MAEQVAELQLELIAKVDQLVNGLKKVDRSVKNTADKATTGNKKLQSAFRETAASIAAFQGPLGPLAGRVNALGAAVGRSGLILTGFGAIMVGMTLAMKKALDASAAYNREMFRLEGIVKATGGAAGFSSQEIGRFATQLGESTMTSASAAREAAGVILTFKSITGNTFKETLKLAQDMSESGFGALKQTSLQLAKALEEPVEGINALRRSGVSFSVEQKEMIKGFVESGDKARAQAEILKVVNKQVGGVGVNAAKGLAGAMDTLGERVTRTWEQLGNTLPVELATKAVNALSEAILKYLKPAEDAAEAQSKFNDFLKPNAEALALMGQNISSIDPKNLVEVNRAMEIMANVGVDLRNKNAALNETQTKLITTNNALMQAQNGLAVAQDNYDKALARNDGSVVAFQQVLNIFTEKVAKLTPQIGELSEQTAVLATAHLAGAQAADEEAAANEKLETQFQLAASQEKENIALSDERAKRLQKLTEAANPLSEAIKKQAENVAFLSTQMEAGQLSLQLFQEIMAGMALENEELNILPDVDPEKLAERLVAMDEQFATEEEKLAIHLGKNMELIAEAADAGVISEEDAAARRLKVLEQFNKSKDALESKQFVKGLGDAQKFFSGMMSLTQNSSKGLFKLMKAGALASALVNTYASVNKAMAEVPYPWNIAAAGAALVSGLGQVASIRSTSFGSGGGGGGGAPSGGGGGGGGAVSSPSSTATPELVSPQGAQGGLAATINLGDDDDLISKSAVRRLIERLNDEIADGAQLASIRAV